MYFNRRILLKYRCYILCDIHTIDIYYVTHIYILFNVHRIRWHNKRIKTVAVAKCCVIIVAGLTNDDMCKDTEVSSHVKIRMISSTIILNWLSSTINYSKRKEMRSSDIFWKLCEGKWRVQQFIMSYVVVWNNLWNPLWFYWKLRWLRKNKIILIEAQEISDPKLDA